MLKEMILPIAMPRKIPNAPPIRQIMTASIKNCFLITEGFAPMAFRIPISRVRSVTETSMMFIKPIEAPIRVIPPMAMPPKTTYFRFSNKVCAIASLLLISKVVGFCNFDLSDIPEFGRSLSNNGFLKVICRNHYRDGIGRIGIGVNQFGF
jgi:hypothetical protein